MQGTSFFFSSKKETRTTKIWNFTFICISRIGLPGSGINELKQPGADEFVNKTRRLVNGKVE